MRNYLATAEFLVAKPEGEVMGVESRRKEINNKYLTGVTT